MSDSIDSPTGMLRQRTIAPHIQDLGGFQARRLLPAEGVTMVGSFIFFDHLGPAVFPAGKGVDVRPHPHINLATVTYLFEGSLFHRDSIGSEREIQPGAVNWMTAGRGIVHSERTSPAARESESTLHGIQTWVALPDIYEETDPWFCHYPAADIPRWTEAGVEFVLIAGAAFGRISPVRVYSPTIYLDVKLSVGKDSPLGDRSSFILPSDYAERAVYAVTPGVLIDGESLPQHHLVVLTAGRNVEISGVEDGARCMIIGGEPVGTRYKWWNFVSSSLERIERAKQDWRDGRFDPVPGETEFIPLPEDV